jgi:hypothetical protein
MLDSLDQLSGDDGGRQLEWLPKTLPSDVYLILSTLPEEQYICLPKLKVSNLLKKRGKKDEIFRLCSRPKKNGLIYLSYLVIFP